ncbi:hypothetical protein [Cellulomonas cellasea]|uniref:Uncharacterized protein n=1 Tax=Cellulomonas cellasea TaxID=43670 RepID=A0A4Y3L1K6_9CELL|nr:hypothetical protein [Cellulomonas cellasea]GEA90242.1 hypothetical protein CCE01nite_41910 [Cellulomonas cellasea]
MSDEPLGDEGLDIGLRTMARDEPGFRISFEVRAAGDPQNIEFPLEVDNRITWWKSLELYMALIPGYYLPIGRRIETKNRARSAETYVQPFSISKFGRVGLWKEGVLGFGAHAIDWDYNAWGNRGREFVFSWHED